MNSRIMVNKSLGKRVNSSKLWPCTKHLRVVGAFSFKLKKNNQSEVAS